jgi:hypothetical protein
MERPRVRIAAAVLALLVVVSCLGLYRLLGPYGVIRDLDRRYRQIERGARRLDVEATMGAGGVPYVGPYVAYWDDAPLSDAESGQIVGAVRYTVQTFYLPVTFEFTFDRTGRLVGKHRYD